MAWFSGVLSPGAQGIVDKRPPGPVKITKYKPAEKTREIIGIRGTPTLINLTNASSLTTTIFDYTTRADSARILLTNDTGGTRIMRGCSMRGKLVTKLADTEGYVHDKFVDYESIEKNGEIKYELGNDFVVTIVQVNKLADYTWKNNKAKRHMYTVDFHGFRSYFEPGEWYTVEIGGAGEEEYIDSVCECYSVRCSSYASGMPYTSVTFREIYENWKFDSNETARSIASGQWGREQSGRVVTVAASTHIGDADYYCDGTADQVEILAAIAYLVSTGGGTVRCVGGVFNTAAAIVLNDHITLDIAPGAMIKKNGNFNAVQCVGTSGTHKHDVGITGGGTITRDAADENSKQLVYLEYSDDVRMDGIIIDNSFYHGIHSVDCTDVKITTLKISNCEQNGIYVTRGIVVIIYGVSVTECADEGIGLYDLTGTDSGCQIINCSISDCGNIGIKVTSCQSIVQSNQITGCTNYGIYITDAAVGTMVNNNRCYNNGADTGIANTNFNNFYDGGTDTQVG